MAFEGFDRASGIGGSDVPAILGVSPWDSPIDVWLEKTRHPSWHPKPQTEEMRWGTLLEPVLRLAYEQDTNKRVHAPGDRTYWGGDDPPYRYAHIDGLVEGEGIWEGKFPIRTFRNWQDGPPVYVQAQVQHYLDITGEPWCDVSCLLPGADFKTFRVPADHDTQAHIRTVLRRFWFDHVLTKEPPERLAAVVEYPTHKSDLLLVADEQAELLAEELRLIRSEAALRGEDEEAVKEQLKRMIGAAAGMTGNGWRIRFKKNRDTEKVEWKLVAGVWRRQLEAIANVLVDGDVREAQRLLTDGPDPDTVIRLYTTTQPGARPFVFEEDK